MSRQVRRGWTRLDAVGRSWTRLDAVGRSWTRLDAEAGGRPTPRACVRPHPPTYDFVCPLRAGASRILGPPRIYTAFSPSPDARFLLTAYFKRPFSYLVPCGRFPKVVQIWDAATGAPLHEVADLPLAENIPIAFNSVRQGPRNIGWRDDHPATIFWAECQDKGDPAIAAEPRDIVYTAPVNGGAGLGAGAGLAPLSDVREVCRTNLRFMGISWCDEDLAICYESEYKTRRSVWTLIAPGRPGEPGRVLFDRNYEDSYTDPGAPMTRRTARDTRVLMTIDSEGSSPGRKLLMQGQGATPEGYRPFLDVLDLATRDTRRVWTCEGAQYAKLGSLLNDEPGRTYRSLDGLEMFMTRETPSDPTQYYWVSLRDAGDNAPVQVTERQMTYFPHPYPTLKDHTKEVLRYTRDDGVELNGTLYLPPGWDKERDGPLPCILVSAPAAQTGGGDGVVGGWGGRGSGVGGRGRSGSVGSVVVGAAFH